MVEEGSGDNNAPEEQDDSDPPEDGDRQDADSSDDDSSEEEDSETPDKRKWRLIALAVLAGGIAIAVALYMLRPQQEGQEPPDRAPLVSTEQVRLQSGPIVVTGQGTVRPTQDLSVSLQVSGRVVYVNPRLTEGGRVRQGERLVQVEPDDFRNRVVQIRGEVERARLELERAIERRETAREEFQRLRDRIAERQSSDPGSGLEADFIRPGETGPSDPGTDLPVEPSPLALGEPQVAAARAALRGAQAQLRNAQLGVQRTYVTAPFDAVVEATQVERGQFVSAGQQLARLYSAGSVEVPIPLTQEQAALIPGLFALNAGSRRGGKPATVSIDYGGTTYNWDGFVDRTQASLDPQTRTVAAIVRVSRPMDGGRAENPEAADAEVPPLLPGFFATVEIIGRTPERYFSIPSDALRDGRRVWVVRDGRLAFVPVSVITTEGGRSFITAPGLKDGDRVVTGELASASEGLEVRTDRRTTTPAIDARRKGGTQPRYSDDETP